VPNGALREMPIRLRPEQARWSATVAGLIGVINQPPRRTILVQGIVFDQYPIGDPLRERLALVRLLQTGLISESLLAQRWGVHRNTLGRWLRRYEADGLEGLKRGALTAVAAAAEPPGTGQLGLALDDGPVVEVAAASVAPEPDEPVVKEVPARAVPTRHAGLSLVLGAMQQLLGPVLATLSDGTGRLARTVQALVLYLLAGFLNPEQTKAAARRELGLLLGRRALPGVHAVRRHLPQLTANGLPARLSDALARRYLALGWVRPWAWLVDGHFCPYHGQAKLAKAWSSLRRLAMPGHHQTWVHDPRGRPLIVRITQAFELFADTLPVVAGDIQRLLGEAGRPEQTVVVFDRGGYAAPVFRALNAQGIGWITWLKRKVALPAEAFTETMEITHERQAPVRVWFTETRVPVPGCHEAVYAVAWHEGDPAHQVALLSNLDRVAPGEWTPQRLIQAIQRWPQEIAFKESKAHVGLDWPDGYEIAPIDETVRVPNPERRRLQQRIAELVAREKRWRQRRLHAKTERSRAKATARWRGLRSAITRLTHKHDALAATVTYASLDRPAQAWLRTERALLVATLRAAAFHLRAQLLEAIEGVFPDYRERSKCLQVLLDGGGWFVPGAQVDTYILHAPETPRYRKAALALCRQLNGMRIPSPGRPDRTLRWAVHCPLPAPIP
jgi:hypothetical protein